MTFDIETIKAIARKANHDGKMETVAVCLEWLENLIPLGGKHDDFQAFCTELERNSPSIEDFT